MLLTYAFIGTHQLGGYGSAGRCHQRDRIRGVRARIRGTGFSSTMGRIEGRGS